MTAAASKTQPYGLFLTATRHALGEAATFVTAPLVSQSSGEAARRMGGRVPGRCWGRALPGPGPSSKMGPRRRDPDGKNVAARPGAHWPPGFPGGREVGGWSRPSGPLARAPAASPGSGGASRGWAGRLADRPGRRAADLARQRALDWPARPASFVAHRRLAGPEQADSASRARAPRPSPSKPHPPARACARRKPGGKGAVFRNRSAAAGGPGRRKSLAQRGWPRDGAPPHDRLTAPTVPASGGHLTGVTRTERFDPLEASGRGRTKERPRDFNAVMADRDTAQSEGAAIPLGPKFLAQHGGST